NKECIVIYFDGKPSEEKIATQRQRQQQREKAQSGANNAIDVLRNRVESGHSVRKANFCEVRKFLRRCFKWSTPDRDALIGFLESKGWRVVLCETEADVRIAKFACVDDIIVSRDSDLLVYANVQTLWRPIGQATQGKFLVYKVPAILAALSMTRSQLTTLGIISSNDYSRNIPTLGIATNYGLSFSLPIKVFVHMQQTPTIATSSTSSPHTLSYTVLRSEFDRICKVFALRKEQQRTNQEKRSDAWVPRHKSHQHFNRFRTIDRGPPNPPASLSLQRPQHRPRYSFKTRQQRKEHNPPTSMTLYKLKPYKVPPEKPVVPPQLKSKKPSIRAAITNQKKKTILNALDFEHPLTSLDMGQLHTNIRGLHNADPSLADEALQCIQGAVREASNIKRRCQQLIAMYLGVVLSSNTINNTDRDILDHICVRLSENGINQAKMQVIPTTSPTDTMASSSTADTSTSSSSTTMSSAMSTSATDEVEDENHETRDDEDSNQNMQQIFLQSVMICLYSKNRPRNSSTAANFITRLEELGLLCVDDVLVQGSRRRETNYAPSSLVRSVTSQLSSEIKRHYVNGSYNLYKKLIRQMDQKLIPQISDVDLTTNISSIENFARLNALAMHCWTPIPLSPVRHGYVTFSEYDLGNFFWSCSKLQAKLKDLMAIDFPNDPTNKFSKTWCVSDWLPGKEPGFLLKEFVCGVGREGLTVRQQGKAGHRAAIIQHSFQELFNHINNLRQRSFDPRTYNQKGYVLCGSIKTNGHCLQLLAYKLRELQSVRYRRYKNDLLPNRLLTTTGGTDYYLTEVRNLVKSPKDVEDLLGCSPGNVREEVRVLGIDLGQAFVVGASAVQATAPGRKCKKRRKKHKKRRRRRQKKRADRSFMLGMDPSQPIYYNLTAKQKAVYQPTFKFRRWLEEKKRNPLITVGSRMEESSSIQHDHALDDLALQDKETISTVCDIESNIPPLRGPDANLVEYLKYREKYAAQLDQIYNKDALYKRHALSDISLSG
ncbi:hypothetical protein FBU30_010621, partial [Linnemannia zychae]